MNVNVNVNGSYLKGNNQLFKRKNIYCLNRGNINESLQLKAKDF